MSVIPSDSFQHRFRAMGSPCEIIVRGCDSEFGAHVTAKVEAEVRRLEAAYSRFQPDTITTRINQSAGSGEAIAVDEETARLLDYADTCFHQSNGLFDITSGSLRKIWNYQHLAESQQLPTEEVIQESLSRVGWSRVVWGKKRISLPVAGMEIDFGGIVKEYAADCAAGIAEAAGIETGLVELGGDIRIIGTATADLPWQVGIRDPFRTEKACALIPMQRGGLASSGDYERYSVIQGKKYSHILNPKSGWPVEGYSSVSVVADQCVIAGSAATIAVLKGSDGRQWLDELGLPFLCIDEEGATFGSLG